MVSSLLYEESVWELLQNSKEPVIIYGMGNGADKILAQFEKLNIKCSGVIASDDFVRGQSFRGFTVKRLAQIESEYDSFTVAIAFATQREEVMKNIKSISLKHKTVVPGVPVLGNSICDREFLKNNTEKINRAYELMADDFSKKVFKDALSFYYKGELDLLWNITSDKDEVFTKILKLSDDEAYLDLGAYRGDTIEEFLKYTSGRYYSITALEPDAKTFKKLEAFAKGLKNTELYQKGVWSKNDTLLFNSKAGRSSSLSKSSGVPVEVVSVDSLMGGRKVSYIKMDTEGAEKMAVRGAENTLKIKKPKLNIAAYHTFEDLFDIPLEINKINEKYSFYLRHHPYIPCWDLNLYCI